MKQKTLSRSASLSLVLIAFAVIVWSGIQGYKFVHGIKTSNEELFDKVYKLEALKAISVTAQKTNEVYLMTLNALRVRRPDVPPMLATEIALGIAEAYVLHAKNPVITPALILGIIEAESYFKSTVTSSAGAEGLMQVMPSTGYPYLKYLLHMDMSTEGVISKLHQARLNIRVGTAVINDYYYIAESRFRSSVPINKVICYALTMYYMGEGNLNGLLDKNKGKSNILEGVSYFDRVLKFKSLWDKAYEDTRIGE